MAKELLWLCQISELLCVYCSQNHIYFLVIIEKKSLFNVFTLKTQSIVKYDNTVKKKNLQSGIQIVVVQLNGGKVVQEKEKHITKSFWEGTLEIIFFQSCFKGDVIAGL